ncbi:hypothetical protein COB21_05810 [Candidatus Aerophobetes bacterium]|uniref:Aldehyde dehydrogenase domain-containing protein n=1 Tax=Aerophobetes bacterium TaxID=2030807 RepID=A0A2A4WXV9_UNCAE|nr:MAG: hypothetical protein COB21_05810 [Candidatus Aerophobetes bacterium]
MNKETSSHSLQSLLSLLDNIEPSITDEQILETSLQLGEALLHHVPLESDASQSRYHEKFNLLLNDQLGKAFFHAIADQCFRSLNSKRSMDQYQYLLSLYDLPTSLSGIDRVKFLSIGSLYKKIPSYCKKAIYNYLAKQARPFFLSSQELSSKSISTPGLESNIDCYCSIPLGASDVQDHVNFYKFFAERTDLSQITINIENLLLNGQSFSFSDELQCFTSHVESILNAYIKKRKTTSSITFFLEANLYQHEEILLEAFVHLLTMKSYKNISLGIVLHSYYPDSYLAAKKICIAAKKRVKEGGNPTIITLSKGKFLKKEAQQASSGGYPQPCFLKKELTDANFKKILNLLINKSSITHTHVQVFTHNLLDIAYALVLKNKNGIDQGLSFEMVQNLSSPLRKTLINMNERVVERKTYVPKRYEQQAIITLFRKISDQSNPYSFICSTRGADSESSEWKNQAKSFENSFALMSDTPETSRLLSVQPVSLYDRFIHEPPLWFMRSDGHDVIKKALIKPTYTPITSACLKKENTQRIAKHSPHNSSSILYHYPLPEDKSIEKVLKQLKKPGPICLKLEAEKLKESITKALDYLRKNKATFIKHQVYDLAMPFYLASEQVRAAIDFGQYAINSFDPLLRGTDIDFSPVGSIFVHPHPRSALSTAAQSVFNALLCGNTIMVGADKSCVDTLYTFVSALWESGITQEQLLFLPVDDEILESVAKSDHVDMMYYFGSKKQALNLYKKRGNKGFRAELEGKNTMIITAMSDRNLAIRHLVDSSFQFSGQYPFATSLAIVEKEVFHDPSFKKSLIDAVQNLKCGPAYDPSSTITPLIGPLSPMQEETLNNTRSNAWILKPKRLDENSLLYSPGVLWGVKRGSVFHSSPLSLPVLAVMEAENLDKAIYLANNTPFGLAACLESLDIREHKQWINSIKAGSRFINIPSTSLMVKKNPICAIKGSIIGPSRSRGGPNSLIPYVKIEQKDIPKEKFPINQKVNNLTRLLEKISLSAEDLGLWYASISSYSFFFQQYKRERDLVKVMGEDHTLLYRPLKKIVFRITNKDKPLDFLRIFAATLTAHVHMEVSWEQSPDLSDKQIDWGNLLPTCRITQESHETFLNKVRLGNFQLIRTIGAPEEALYLAAANNGGRIEPGSPFSNGRFELLRYFHEIITSSTYHRFGNLGLREGEMRHPNY